MFNIIQNQPTASERMSLLSGSSSTSSGSINRIGSLSELNAISQIPFLCIRQHKESKRANINKFLLRLKRWRTAYKRCRSLENCYFSGLCCNFSNFYNVHNDKNELLLGAVQENGICANEFEDVVVHDLQDGLLFSVEFEENTGYISTQMKFSVVSSAKMCIGSVLRVCSFMESPRYEILNWDDELLFGIGPPLTSGIKSYDYSRKYEVISNDGRMVANFIQQGRTISLNYDMRETLQLHHKTLILALGFVLDMLRHEEYS